MPSTRLPNLNRVIIVGNLTGEPDDTDDLGMMNITEMKKTIKLRRIDGKT